MSQKWESHALLGRMAVQALPPWAQEELKNKRPSGEELSLLPECNTLLDQLAASCLMMDWAYDERFNSYGKQADTQPIPHMLPDHSGKGAFFSGNAPDPGKFAQILTGLMEKTLHAYRAENYLDFTRYGGIMGHFLQDVTAPTHTLTPALTRALFPDPVPGRLKGMGSMCYRIAEKIAMEEAECFPDIPQAVFSLTNKAFQAADRARYLLGELLHRAYAGDHAGCEELLTGPARDAAMLTAEAFLTVLSIARNKPGSAEISPLPLTKLSPLYHHPDLYAYAPPGVYCENGLLLPMTLLSAEGNRPCEDGLGMKGHSGMKFFLNKVFHTLEFTLGLAPFPESMDPRMGLEFTVETSPDWDPTFSEDMHYGTTPLLTIPLKAGAAPCRYTVDLGDCTTLVLACKAAPYRTEEGGIDFIIPHLGIEKALLY